MSSENIEQSGLELLRLAPHILRARDFRLYAEGSRRFIDLWQNGGAAVLGHTPPLFLREIKNTASRGLYAPLPHFTEQRFLKALAAILPNRNCKIYAAPPAELADAVNKVSGNANAPLWRPYLDFCLPDTAPPPDKAPLVIPILPGVQIWRGGLPLGLCVCAFMPECENELARVLPPGDLLPPVLLAAAARGIWDIIAAAPARANVKFPRVNKALQNGRWRRRGIYLFPRTVPAGEEWAALFQRFLAAGFLLPPFPDHPLILPAVMSAGEEAKLAKALREI